ncbi:MAG: hypothetical protein NWT00_08860 [Beijerinckiaceae bacterium]|nr:hypothetical protein [Beijerinckiaceae bacterium]
MPAQKPYGSSCVTAAIHGKASFIRGTRTSAAAFRAPWKHAKTTRVHAGQAGFCVTMSARLSIRAFSSEVEPGSLESAIVASIASPQTGQFPASIAFFPLLGHKADTKQCKRPGQS